MMKTAECRLQLPQLQSEQYQGLVAFCKNAQGFCQVHEYENLNRLTTNKGQDVESFVVPECAEVDRMKTTAAIFQVMTLHCAPSVVLYTGSRYASEWTNQDYRKYKAMADESGHVYFPIPRQWQQDEFGKGGIYTDLDEDFFVSSLFNIKKPLWPQIVKDYFCSTFGPPCPHCADLEDCVIMHGPFVCPDVEKPPQDMYKFFQNYVKTWQ